MLQKPSLESVVVLVISLAAVGMTVAALVVPEPDQAEIAATPAAPAPAPAAPATKSLAPAAPLAPAVLAAVGAAAPRPVAAGETPGLASKAVPAGMPALGKPAPPAGALGPRMCALSPLHHHGGRQESRRRTAPARVGGVAEPAGEGAGGGGLGAPRPAGGAAEDCGEKPRVEAARPAACCLLDR
jgi:translation initiation factor IF-2